MTRVTGHLLGVLEGASDRQVRDPSHPRVWRHVEGGTPAADVLDA